MMGYNKGGVAKPNSDTTSNSLVSFDSLEYFNIVDIFMLKFFLTFILFIIFFCLKNLNHKKVNVNLKKIILYLIFTLYIILLVKY